MNKKNTKNTKNLFSDFFSATGDYIKKKYPFLIIFLVGFLALSFINFVKISTTETVASFNLNDFEIGQISFKTITAPREFPADSESGVFIEKGEAIVKEGFPVTAESLEKLEKMASSKVYVDIRSYANSEIFLFIVAVMWYLLLSFINFGRKLKPGEIILQVVFVLLNFTVAALCSKFKLFSTPYSICIIIPSSLCVILLSILYGELPSIVFSFVVSLFVFNARNWDVVPFLYTLSTSLLATAIVRKIQRRIDIVFVSIILAIADVIFSVVIAVILNERLSSLGIVFFGVALNGFVSGLLTMGLLTPLELMLNTASVFRLMDLSDLNNTFMRNMLVQASGTYQHSMMVAQLSENACREIGANPLVARVGSYYHDIGKIDQSEYFVENQKGENKHDELNPTLSVSVIRSHVKKGVEKARQLHLPQVIIDIISEHHGNSVIAYFYNEAKLKDPTLNPEDFSYTGNPPSTRESGVVMLADTVEAACRTLENKSIHSIENFIDKLFQGKIDHGQLDNCNLTFSDLTKVKQAFVQILAGYYHSRIEYPDQDNEKKVPVSEKETEPVKSKKSAK